MLEGVASLAEKSLVQLDPAPVVGEPRLRLLETVREFALDQLRAAGELAATQRRHAEWVARLLEAAERPLWSGEWKRWRKRLEEEQHNLRAALLWTAEAGEAELGLRLFGAALDQRYPFTAAEPDELRRLLEALLNASGGARTAARGKALRARAQLGGVRRGVAIGAANAMADMEEARAIFAERGETWLYADALLSLSSLVGRSNLARARALAEEALASFDRLNDAAGHSGVVYFLGMLAVNAGRDDLAHTFLEESLALCRELGLDYFLGEGSALWGLAMLAERRGDEAAARHLHEETLVVRRRANDLEGIGYSLQFLGAQAEREGDIASADARYAECMTVRARLGVHASLDATTIIARGVSAVRGGHPARGAAFMADGLHRYRELGGQWGLEHALSGAATLAFCTGDAGQAARFCAASAARSLPDVVAFVAQSHLRPDRAVLQSALGEAAFAAAWAAGEQLTQAEAFDEAEAYLAAFLHAAEPQPLDARSAALRSPAAPGRSQVATETALPPPYGLSPREVEVLRLVAAGETNREIAAALVVSENTVAFHLKGIFNKTGAANRTEAAALAHRHGLSSPVP